MDEHFKWRSPANKPRKLPDPFPEGVQELKKFVQEMGGRVRVLSIVGNRIRLKMHTLTGMDYDLTLRAEKYLLRPVICNCSIQLGPTTLCVRPTASYFELHPEKTYNPAEGSLVTAVCAVLMRIDSLYARGRIR